jgi:protein SCO1/2
VARPAAGRYIGGMASEPKRATRLLWALMVGMMVVAAVAVITIWQVVRSGPRGDPTAAAEIGGGFTLTDQTGRTVTDRAYDGRYRLIYFGYTFCPDACPTELQTMAQAVDALGSAGAAVQPIFITVDPARDTAEKLAHYVPLFDKRLVGLTGTPEQIAAVAKAYKVYYAKVEQPNGAPYLMNHSSFVYLMDPAGKFLTVFQSDMDSDRMAAEIRRYMGTG